jgi:hypothetical protein
MSLLEVFGRRDPTCRAVVIAEIWSSGLHVLWGGHASLKGMKLI